MTKQEFARRAMEIVEICIERNILCKMQISSGRKPNEVTSLLIGRYDGDIYLFIDILATNDRFNEVKKLVEEHEK